MELLLLLPVWASPSPQRCRKEAVTPAPFVSKSPELKKSNSLYFFLFFGYIVFIPVLFLLRVAAAKFYFLGLVTSKNLHRQLRGILFPSNHCAAVNNPRTLPMLFSAPFFVSTFDRVRFSHVSASLCLRLILFNASTWHKHSCCHFYSSQELYSFPTCWKIYSAAQHCTFVSTPDLQKMVHEIHFLSCPKKFSDEAIYIFSGLIASTRHRDH